MLPILTGLLGTLVGLLLGNRMALSREKRKEFNEVALPIFEKLESQRISALNGSFPNDANSFSERSLITLKQHISHHQSKKLESSFANYTKARDTCGTWDDSGNYEFKRPDVLISAIEDLQKYVRRK